MFVILSACLLAAPTTCREERIEQSIDERPPIACIVEGQSTVAVWQTQHPKWVIKTWKCLPKSKLDTAL